jgi:hypothetical protein
MGFEPMIRVLQTLALPLGHVAGRKTRAGDGTRTHDLLLGKETFYQLNYTRISNPAPFTGRKKFYYASSHPSTLYPQKPKHAYFKKVLMQVGGLVLQTRQEMP